MIWKIAGHLMDAVGSAWLFVVLPLALTGLFWHPAWGLLGLLTLLLFVVAGIDAMNPDER